MKGQIALEYLIIFTLIFAALTPLVFLSFDYLDDYKSVSDANSAYNTLSASIDQVFSLSPGSRITTRITMPQSYQKEGSAISNNVLTLKFKLPKGDDLVISRALKGKAQGILPDHEGDYIFLFELFDTNIVNVTYIGG